VKGLLNLLELDGFGTLTGKAASLWSSIGLPIELTDVAAIRELSNQSSRFAVAIKSLVS
jgi:hypothetical protein